MGKILRKIEELANNRDKVGSQESYLALCQLYKAIQTFKDCHKAFRKTLKFGLEEWEEMRVAWNEMSMAHLKVLKFDADAWHGGISDVDMNELTTLFTRNQARMKDFKKALEKVEDIGMAIEKHESGL